MIRDFFLIATGTLRKRMLRTSLTMIGIFIGIAAVVSLVSLGQGMQKAIQSQFASVGTDKIIIQGASAAFGPPGQNTAGKVTEKDLRIVRTITGVSRSAGRILRSVNLEYQDTTHTLFAASLSEKPEERALIMEANNIQVQQGRLLKSSDRKKVLAGQNLWNGKHLEKNLELDAKILLNEQSFQVVGLLKKIGAGRDDSILMNEQDARDLFNDTEEYSAIVAQVGKGETPSKIADKINRAIRRERQQKEGFEDFTVSTSEDLIGTINTILGVVQAVFIGVALISLIVGGIGIMNTMYTSVLERTKDIGIMKAIGATNKDILTIFLIESAILGLTGGIIGIILGVTLSKTVEVIGKGIIGNLLQASFPIPLITGSLAFSCIVGLLSGVLPAIQASKLPPAEALRG
jgi:putative ABC transport system permease protein